MLPARRPAATLALVALISVGALYGALQLQPEVDFVDTVPPDDDVAAYRTMIARLDGVRFVAVYMPYDPESGYGHLRTDPGFDALVYEQRNLTRHLTNALPPNTFSHSLSVYEAMRAGNYMFTKVATSGNAPRSAYSLPDDPATWAQVRDQVRSGSADDVLAADGSSALALFFFETNDNYEARQLAGDAADVVERWSQQRAADHPATHDHQATGLLYSSHYVDQRNIQEVQTWGLAAAAGVLFVLLAALRRPADAVIAVTSLLVALLWTFGAMGWTGVRISFLTVFLAPLVIGVGIDYAIHILHRYGEARDAGLLRDAAFRRALGRTGGAVRLTAGTTAVGLLVLWFVPAPLFAEVGVVASFGIVMAVVASMTVAPALRAVWPDRGRRRQERSVGRVVASAAMTARRHPKTVAAVLAALTVGAALLAVTGTQVASGSAENEFPADDPLLQLQQRVEQEYGSFQTAYLILQGDIATPTALRALYHATLDASAVPLYRDAGSVADLLIADAKTDEGVLDIAAQTATNPGDEEYLPTTRQEAQAALDRLFADPLWRTLAPFSVTREYDLAVVAIDLEPTEDQPQLLALRSALERMRQAVQADVGPDVDVAAAGAPINRAAVLEQTPVDVGIAVFGVAAATWGVLTVVWTRRRGPEGARAAAATTLVVLASALWLLASVPALDWVYGVLHAAGWGPANQAVLSDMFLLAFALTVAMGVDDAVHVTHRYWEGRDAGRPAAQAMRSALTHAGRAITVTTVTTMVAFGLLAGVYFLQSKNLAVLTTLGALYAYVLTLVVIPRVIAGPATRPPGRRHGDGGMG